MAKLFTVNFEDTFEVVAECEEEAREKALLKLISQATSEDFIIIEVLEKEEKDA